MSISCSTCPCISSIATAITSTQRDSRSGILWPAGCLRCQSAYPTVADWADHLTTSFLEVRLKRVLEMRGADGGPWNRLCALPAFWVGLLYDADARAAAWELVRDWTEEERMAMRASVPVQAMAMRFP